jgi:hypothetical protein
MNTIYDWVTVALFAALLIMVVRGAAAGMSAARLLQYLGAAIGCALINWLGNNGYHVAAIACGAFVLLYTWVVLRPFDSPGG